MSNESDPQLSLPSISFAAGSPAKMFPPPEKAPALPKEHDRVSGSNFDESSASFPPLSSSSKTSRAVAPDGCPRCGETCTCLDTEPVPLRFLPSTSGRPTDERACSSLLPTPTASDYGSSLNGDPKDGRGSYRGAGKPSLSTRARAGLLPTPTLCGNYNRRGVSSPTAGDGLQTAVGGRLSPPFVEWMMGFPIAWTEVSELAGSGTLLFPNAPRRSGDTSPISSREVWKLEWRSTRLVREGVTVASARAWNERDKSETRQKPFFAAARYELEGIPSRRKKTLAWIRDALERVRVFPAIPAWW